MSSILKFIGGIGVLSTLLGLLYFGIDWKKWMAYLSPFRLVFVGLVVVLIPLLAALLFYVLGWKKSAETAAYSSFFFLPFGILAFILAFVWFVWKSFK